MTRKERAFVLEAVAFLPCAFLLAIVVPGMVNQHDTMLTFAAFALLAISAGWVTYFIYRTARDFS